jgi:hypothetical protein
VVISWEVKVRKEQVFITQCMIALAQ